ncbi:hypothetical protein EDF60_2717 [Leucobacter luti]|uniref:DUF6020 family protein n=1 Tax=Leucobacter luti TaxID=340320 RepID=UPI00104A3F93|nr:DUF6020 family protein [Leucobacter luti]MCW2289840.1 hypothetical protein [Leucobacter luti]TCK36009.1 hypothetical protein EDF60_2717 [Leucobacter luti]
MTAAIGRAAYFWTSSFRHSSLLTRILGGVVSLLFGFSQALGFRMDTRDSLGLDSAGETVMLLAVGVLASAVFACFLFPLFHFAAEFRGLKADAYRGLWALSAGRRRIVVIGSLLVPWLCYWFLLWPGVTTNDSLNQVSQALGLVPYSDHHPIAHTLAIQAVLRPAVALLGNTAVAIGAVTFVQCVVLATLVGCCVDTLREFKAPGWTLTLILAFFAVHPIVGWYSVSLWKDVWLGAFILAFATLTALIVRRSHAALPIGWNLWGLLILAGLGMMLAKKTGVYVAIPALTLTFFLVARPTRLRWTAAGAATLALYFIVHLCLVTGLQAKQGSEVEAWSIPAQQIARSSQEGALSAEQSAFFSPYFSGVNPGDVYSPHISDPVKNTLDAAVLQEGRTSFVREWLRLGAQNPVVFTEAFLAQTYGYWYPGAKYWVVSSTDWTAIVNTKVPNRPELAPLLEEVTSERNHARGLPSAAATTINEDLRSIPVLGWMLSLGLWTWAAVVLACVALLRKQRAAIAVAAVAALVWGTCMVSPVYAEARYAFPLLLLLPLMCLTAFLPPAPRRVPDIQLNES